jgi:hypothetical protein
MGILSFFYTRPQSITNHELYYITKFHQKIWGQCNENFLTEFRHKIGIFSSKKFDHFFWNYQYFENKTPIFAKVYFKS